MIAYISRRLFLISVFSLVLFIAFATYSFAQEATETTPDTIRPVQTTQIRESVTERVNQKRAAIQQQRATNQTTFTQRLNSITDLTKRSVVERINNAIQTINENKTTRWASVVDLLSDILERIKIKIADMETSGSDVTSINSLVATAEASLADASVAVENQAEKAYTLEITSEQTLKQTIQIVVAELRTDLTTTLELVKDARDAVREVARELSAISTTDVTPSPVEDDTIM